MHTNRRFLVLSVALLAFVGSSQAQVALDRNLVYIPVSVQGPKNVYVTGLTKENFKLLEDGIEQTITTFHGENEPIDIDMILALGNLQRGRATFDSDKIRSAISAFRQTGNPKNRFIVEEMSFGANGIFDAMSRHLARLADSSTNARRALLVITDGFEASGGDPGHALAEYSRKLDIPVHIVYAAANAAGSDDIREMGRGGGIGGRGSIIGNGGAVYEEISNYSGGRLYQAEADTQLKSALEQLGQELRSQYVLGFKSTNDAKNDKWRKIEIKMQKPPEGLKEKDLKPKVKGRYFVPKAQK